MTATLSGFLTALLVLFGCSGDQEFLNALRGHGIDYVSPEWAIADGHQVCATLDTGQSPEEIAEQLMQQTSLDGYHAGFFVGASIRAFCPQYA